jgi:nicotinamide mononucleotide transporter
MAMVEIARFLKAEASGWRFGEAVWFLFCIAAVVSLSVWWGDGACGIAAAVTGVAYTVLAGKGKRSCFLFGLANTPLYAWISWRSGYYGDMALNLYYLSMMIPGWLAWSRSAHAGGEGAGMVRSELTPRETRLWAAGMAAAAVALYWVLARLGGNRPLCDALTNVLSVAGMVFTVRRLSAQWIMWIAVDAIEIFMWLSVWRRTGAAVSVLLMWVLFLANGVYLWRVWLRSTTRPDAGDCGQTVSQPNAGPF